MKNNADFYSDYYELPCKKHPTASPIGICAYCLNDRLTNLVCPDCGDQRLSSCSCSDFSLDPNDSCSVEVGRISFLIENERSNKNGSPDRKSNKKMKNSDEVFSLKRKHGFWRIGRLFKKNTRKAKDFGSKSVNRQTFDEISQISVGDSNNNNNKINVSRSRSVCSSRGGWFLGSEDGSGARSSISAARSSSVNGGLGFDPDRKSGFSETEPRKSGFEARRSNFSETEQQRKSGFSETETRRFGFEGRKSNFSETEYRKSNFSETDPRKSGFDGRKSNFSETEQKKSNHSEMDPRKSNFGIEKRETSGLKSIDAKDKRACSLKESYFNDIEESKFIDLKFEFSSNEPNPQDQSDQSVSAFGSMRCGERNGMVLSHGGGGSCRVTMNERGIKQSRKSFAGGWKWIFRKKVEEEDAISVNF